MACCCASISARDRANLLVISEDLPILAEIAESRASTDRLLAELQPTMGNGPVTLERTTVIRQEGDIIAPTARMFDTNLSGQSEQTIVWSTIDK